MLPSSPSPSLTLSIPQASNLPPSRIRVDDEEGGAPITRHHIGELCIRAKTIVPPGVDCVFDVGMEGDDSGPNDLGKEGRGGEGATRSRPGNDILVVVGGGPRESSDRTSRATLVREAVEIESSKSRGPGKRSATGRLRRTKTSAAGGLGHSTINKDRGVDGA